MLNHQEKYLKYKEKYLYLKKWELKGGAEKGIEKDLQEGI